ncbi:MAG: prepilin-type N-terminal cleavage/methylation domain-containing protein [Candidatus Niyogibacteria bacterium]|nr:prepilin-type N-terminal cleavage/methylation domain-containing protein [Candidatus Niyogibacteria bacterium]
MFYKEKSRGFTLIELLVVIAIIGVLASVVLASLNTARKKSRDARRIADIKQLQLAAELYFDSNSFYPVALVDMVTGGQIPAIPNDPLSTATTPILYPYCQRSNTSYHLGATLEETTNPALQSDVDSASGTCQNGTDFDGTAPAVYDVTP